jgi:hypothetical protein
MNYAEYVIAGWVITGVAILVYWLRLIQRTRRAERLDSEQ